MSDTATTSTAAVFNVNDELYKLQALHDHYKDLLDQAVDTLNSIELTDDQITRVSYLMRNDTVALRAIGAQLFEDISNSENLSSRALIERAVEQARLEIKDFLRPMISIMIQDEVREIAPTIIRDLVQETLYRENDSAMRDLSMLRSIMGTICKDHLVERIMPVVESKATQTAAAAVANYMEQAQTNRPTAD